MHKGISLLFILLLPLAVAHATPEKIEMWFLSPDHYKHALHRLDSVSVSPFVVQKRVCQKMGEYCFDPQIGLYKESGLDYEIVDTEEVIDEESSREHLQGTDTELVHCDRDLYFDVFCGKASANEKSDAKLEVWIDISSSLRKIDHHPEGQSCLRKSFVERLKHKCGDELKIKVFNTTLKTMGGLDSLCYSVGLNDGDRLIQWMKDSDADYLVVITDIHELTTDIANFLAMNNGSIRGDKADDPMVAAELLSRIDSLARQCR